MRGALTFAAATAAALLSSGTVALPVVAHAGSVADMLVEEHNTLNGTAPGTNSHPSEQSDFVSIASASNTLKFQIHNNFASTKGLRAYVTGRDMSGAVVMLSSSGQWYRPNAGGSMVPIALPSDADISISLSSSMGATSEFTIPDYIESGRVYIADGELTFSVVSSDLGTTTLVEPSAANPNDPSANVNWGFVELTNLASAGIFANISFVDFVGLVMGMKLTLGSGETQQVEGLTSDAVQKVCDEMNAQAAQDGQPWDKMCMTDPSTGKALRIMAPNLYVSGHAGSMDGYYTDYVDKVWAKYTNEDLTINTQSSAGSVACRVKPSVNNAAKQVLSCAGDNREYVKPVTSDIWGCNSGPFAIIDGDNDVHKAVVPRLCAAFTRSELLQDGGNVTPSESGPAIYYKESPTNHYSRIVHQHQTDGKGYAFSYDDVNPDGQNAAGVVAGAAPQLLEIFVGGMTSSGGGNTSYARSIEGGRGRAPVRRRLTRFDRFALGMH